MLFNALPADVVEIFVFWDKSLVVQNTFFDKKKSEIWYSWLKIGKERLQNMCCKHDDVSTVNLRKL